jgi:two-component system cell cycle sensor histidine kinase/response regulator CckA
MAELCAACAERHGASSYGDRTQAALSARILIVDDDMAMRDFVDDVLRDAGYWTVRAIDGQDALEMADRLGPFDLLLTDELMPRMPGHELAQRLRCRHRDLKVLYLTAHSDLLPKEELKQWENEALLDKPATPDDLLDAISVLLSRDAGERHAT